MAEVALEPRTGFEGIAVPGRYNVANGADPGVVIAERVGLAVTQIAAFHRQTDSVANAVKDIAKLDLPMGPKRAAASGLALIGIAPTQWLAIAEGEEGRALLTRLTQALGGTAATVDQSDAKAMLRLSGPRARDVLAKGCSLDLHTRVFAVNDAATTQMALIPAQICLIDDKPTFDLAVPLSYAGSFWSWLSASAAEFGYEVTAKPAA